jgi:2-keto-4-pentenoate hydratase/2-oxohepta-3-ene-1,7-dioic acid hydratase in catechol pathway
MKLATFRVETALGSHTRVGVVDGASLLDVTAGYACILREEEHPTPIEQSVMEAPPDMLAFLQAGDIAMDAARMISEREFDWDDRSPGGSRIRYADDEVSLSSPLVRPNTIRDFSVFEDHGPDDKPDVWYEMPVQYKGNPDTIVPPDSDVTWPDWEDRLDYELAVAAVVGKEGKDIDPEDAYDHIAGYTIFNDFSARDTQFREMEAMLGPAKGKDFANGLGPYIVTTDAFDPTDAAMYARVNGERWSAGNLGDMYHSFADIVAHASQGETLHPGDILGSGTVGGGSGWDLDQWLQRGDTVELEVEGIGTLNHRVISSE